MSEKEAVVIQHGLGYMKRIMIRDLDIEALAPEMKEFVWETVLSLVEKAKEMNLKWKHVDIVMQVKHQSYQSLETTANKVKVDG